MRKLAILDDYNSEIFKLTCWARLYENFKITTFNEKQTDEVLSEFECIVTVRERTMIDQKFLDAATNLKHLALTGRLSGQADLVSLQQKGIAVSYTDGSGQAASELTIALILGSIKRIQMQHQSVAQGAWQNGLSKSLAGKTLGILGLGRVGLKVAQFGKLMDMNVISWGPTADNGRSEKYGLQRIPLTEVLSQSDVLAICLRLSEKTRNLLAAPELERLKTGSLLVNTSRAEIIVKNDLYKELETGRFNAALDVFHNEPLDEDDPLRKFSNVLLSPHMGYVTEEVYEIFFEQVVDNIIAWDSGKPYKNALAD